nr:glutaminyl-peptide cyclotransferase-like isoform X1 [Procambarus clarkii]
MDPKCPGFFFLLYAFLLFHSTLAEEKCDKRSPSVWYTAKETHEGIGLSDEQLQAISRMSDMKHFQSVLQPMLVPRVVGSENHANVRKHIVKTMRDLGWTVEESAFDDNTPFGQKRFTNIIANLNPNAPRHLVLACHYDSKIDREGTFIGATDSAVPCAMMLNLAKVMQANLDQHRQTQSDLTLQFIFFDGEEAFRQWSATDSLYGARNLAAKMEASAYPQSNADGTTYLNRIDLFVLLDLLGTKDVKFSSYFRNTDRWYARFMSYERRLNDLQLLHRRRFMFNKDTFYGAGIADDHIPFLERSVPVVHVIPVPFPSVWHKSSDNESALHYPSIQNFNKILRAFVADYLHLVI